MYMKKKILLVDDKREFRSLVKMYLNKKYEVETCGNGMEALNLLQDGYLPNVIVSDLNMPMVDGYSLLDQLKASGLYSQIPVIILSSIDKSSNKVELIQKGAEDYLVKPFNPQELEVRIERILRVEI